MIKGSVLQEDVTIPNLSIPNNRVSKNLMEKFIELQGKREKSIIIVGSCFCISSDNL